MAYMVISANCFRIWVVSTLNQVKLINLHYIRSMANNNIIIIDPNKWITQAEKAKQRGCSIQYINKLIRLNKLVSYPIPQIGIVLVEKQPISKIG